MRAKWLLVAALGFWCSWAVAADWPQWRGLHRDAKVADFKAPASWPKELTKKWQVAVGDGVATPALVGDKLYVFTREGSDEIVRCLEAATGKEVWADKYAAKPPPGPGGRFPGPRCSPTVADGKLIVVGVQGTLSCYEAAGGKLLWRKETGSPPRFSAASSPIVLDGLCIAQVGGDNGGTISAFDLKSGNEKWKSAGEGTAYASPELVTVDGIQALVTESSNSVVAVSAADGKLLWKTPFKIRYNACTPVVEGQTVIYSGAGQGTKAVKLKKEGDKLAAEELWSNDQGVMFNSPVVKDGKVYGISSDGNLFCITDGGKTAWTTPLKGGGYGSVVDAGAVLFAITPASELIVFEPTDKEFKKLASYKVTGNQVHAYPIITGNRIFIKDKNAMTLWTID